MRFMNMPSPQLIFSRCKSNLRRVLSLVESFQQLVGGKPLKTSTKYTDLLRAAVVLLHASLEDLLRSLEEARIPQQVRDGVGLEGVLFGSPDDRTRKEKLSLSELARIHRDRHVGDVIQISLERELETRTYNNAQDVARALHRLGLQLTLSNHKKGELDVMMKRRHHIAHRADRQPRATPGRHAALPLKSTTVLTWVELVQSLSEDLQTQLSTRSRT